MNTSIRIGKKNKRMVEWKQKKKPQIITFLTPNIDNFKKWKKLRLMIKENLARHILSQEQKWQFTYLPQNRQIKLRLNL